MKWKQRRQYRARVKAAMEKLLKVAEAYAEAQGALQVLSRPGIGMARFNVNNDDPYADSWQKFGNRYWTDGDWADDHEKALTEMLKKKFDELPAAATEFWKAVQDVPQSVR